MTKFSQNESDILEEENVGEEEQEEENGIEYFYDSEEEEKEEEVVVAEMEKVEEEGRSTRNTTTVSFKPSKQNEDGSYLDDFEKMKQQRQKELLSPRTITNTLYLKKLKEQELERHRQLQKPESSSKKIVKINLDNHQPQTARHNARRARNSAALADEEIQRLAAHPISQSLHIVDPDSSNTKEGGGVYQNLSPQDVKLTIFVPDGLPEKRKAQFKAAQAKIQSEIDRAADQRDEHSKFILESLSTGAGSSNTAGAIPGPRGDPANSASHFSKIGRSGGGGLTKPKTHASSSSKKEIEIHIPLGSNAKRRNKEEYFDAIREEYAVRYLESIGAMPTPANIALVWHF